MTDDPVLHALIDLVQALETGAGEIHTWDTAYTNALKIIRERVAQSSKPQPERS